MDYSKKPMLDRNWLRVGGVCRCDELHLNDLNGVSLLINLEQSNYLKLDSKMSEWIDFANKAKTVWWEDEIGGFARRGEKKSFWGGREIKRDRKGSRVAPVNFFIVRLASRLGPKKSFCRQSPCGGQACG